MTRRSSALAHLTICDLSGQLAGAGATRFLAAFGARVIRVEDPNLEGRWDILRGSLPYVDERRGINLGGSFNNHNVEKLGVTLNLRTERGRELAAALVRASDVVTENFAAGVLARLGFPYERLREGLWEPWGDEMRPHLHAAETLPPLPSPAPATDGQRDGDAAGATPT